MVLKLDHWFSIQYPSRFSQEDFTFSSSDSFINGNFLPFPISVCTAISVTTGVWSLIPGKFLIDGLLVGK